MLPAKDDAALCFASNMLWFKLFRICAAGEMTLQRAAAVAANDLQVIPVMVFLLWPWLFVIGGSRGAA